MTAIFISHRSSDAAEAQELKHWLGQQGHQQLFLDFDPADGIPAGVDWEQRLYQELRRCQALLIVLTPAWLESKWCGNELAIAREKGKAVFVVRVKPCPGGPVVPAIQEVDLTQDRASELEKLARGLKEHGLDPRDAFDWQPDRPIYPGLAAFDVDDAAIFFGRSEESWQVVEALRRLRLQATGSPKLLLITGASGSGKSSLMRAGVLARLGKEPARWITARPFRRGTDALSALAEALAWALPPERRPTSVEAITARLAGPEGAGQLLALTRELRLALERPDATLVLALDQAEELLAAGSGDDAAKLLDLFRATLGAVGNEILVIATIRSDRLGAWQQHASIKATADHGELPFEMLPLGPMPMARIGEIVRGPAAYEGLRIDDDLVDAIRADTASPDALPLLAYTLQYLHRRFAQDGRLTLAEYQSLGGLEGSVRSQADAAIPIEQLSEDDRRALRDAFVPGLVRATAQGGFSRSRALLDTLPPRAEPHLRRLEAMQRAALDWAQAGRREDFLVHRDHRLIDAEGLIAEPRFAARLGEPDRDYLASCRSAQNQREAAEKEAQERELRAAQALAKEQQAKTRRTRLGLAVACGLMLVAAVFAAVAEWQRREADTQKEEARLQLKRANEALAAGLWNNLDFADQQALAPVERTALWTLAQDGGPVRAEFLTQLSKGTERVQRFARRPGPVSRAVGLSWPWPHLARQTLDPILAAIKDTTDPGQIMELLEAVKAVVVQLDTAETALALGQVIAAIEGATDPYQLWALAEMVKTLPVQLDPAQAQAVVGPVLAAIRAEGTTDPGQLGALEEALQQVLAGELDASQAQAVLGQVAATGGRSDPYRLLALVAALQALAEALSPEQVRDALGPVLALIKDTVDREQLEELSEAVRALAGQLDAPQAHAALGTILGALEGTTDPQQLRVLAEAVQALPVQLDGAQGQAALDQAITGMAHAADTNQLLALAEVVQALPVQLEAEQAQAVLGRVLGGLKSATRASDLLTLAKAVQALPMELDAAEAQASLEPVLLALKRADSPWDLRDLAEAVAALPAQLESGQAQAALAPILAGIKAADPLLVQELAMALQALAGKLPAEQAHNALGPVLEAIKHHISDRAQALGETGKALAGRLDALHAQAALGPVLAAIQDTTEPDQLLALAETMQALPAQLDARQAEVALRPILQAITNQTDRWALRSIAGATEALAPKLGAAQAEVVLAIAGRGLAWAQTSEEAASWAGALVAVLPREEPGIFLYETVKALKYPTAAGAATDVLLDALRDIDANAPGKEAGLAANLAWLTGAYPAIDLDDPPHCPEPPPGQQDLACPVGGA